MRIHTLYVYYFIISLFLFFFLRISTIIFQTTICAAKQDNTKVAVRACTTPTKLSVLLRLAAPKREISASQAPRAVDTRFRHDLSPGVVLWIRKRLLVLIDSSHKTLRVGL